MQTLTLVILVPLFFLCIAKLVRHTREDRAQTYVGLPTIVVRAQSGLGIVMIGLIALVALAVVASLLGWRV